MSRRPKPNPELEPHVPDWDKEIPSDYVLVKQLKEKLKTPFWRRSIQDWRERRETKRMVEHLRNLGFE